MRLPLQLVDLTQRFRSEDVAVQNSGEVSALKGEGRFRLRGRESVVRYRLDRIGFPEAAEYYFAMKARFESSDAVATSVSVVNGDVSDGRLWHVEKDDATGTHCLTGVVRNSDDALVIYANFAGAGDVTFRIEYFAIAPLNGEPLKLTFVIDPWIERGMPSWKADYIWWFGDIANCLASSERKVETHYVVGDGVAPFFEKHRRSEDATVSVVHSTDLLDIYGTYRRGVVDQRKRLGADAPLGRRRFVELLKAACVQADIVFSVSDMQILKDAVPGALHLYRDAMYCRAPFPDEMTYFDTNGLYHNAALAKQCCEGSASKLPEWFVDKFFPRSDELRDVLSRHGVVEGKFLLLPLQDSYHYNFYDESPFSDQVELVIAASKRFRDSLIVVTQHPDKREISLEAFEELRRFCPNVVYISEIEHFKNVSVRLLPFCSGVVAVSTGVIFQALLRGVPFYPMGAHVLGDLVSATCDKEALGRIGGHLLTRVFYSYRYLHDGRWLLARLCSLSLFKCGALGAEMLAVDLPSNVFSGLRESYRSA